MIAVIGCTLLCRSGKTPETSTASHLYKPERGGRHGASADVESLSADGDTLSRGGGAATHLQRDGQRSSPTAEAAQVATGLITLHTLSAAQAGTHVVSARGQSVYKRVTK